MRPPISWGPVRRHSGTTAGCRGLGAVPPGSRFAPRAIQRLMELEVDGGRFAAAEQLVQRAMADEEIDASALPLYLGPVYWLQGRIADAQQSIEARWAYWNERGEGASEKAIDLVRLHIELRCNPLPVEAVREGLEKAGRYAPEDDRVWLEKPTWPFAPARTIRHSAGSPLACGVAPAMSRSGAPSSTGRWRPTTSRKPGKPSTFARRGVDSGTSPAVGRLAGRAGIAQSEQRALERLIEADPADFAALDRLAELAVQQCQPTRAALLRHQKSEIDAPRGSLSKALSTQPTRDTAEMARLAERLGQRFPRPGPSRPCRSCWTRTATPSVRPAQTRPA